MGNQRGNHYSENHTTLDPFGSEEDRKQFWSFSVHEIGYYDVPASIDYVLHKTGKNTLHYIGHSQGCTTFFIMTSERPEYNDKIDTMQALAPAVYLKNTNLSAIRWMSAWMSYIYVSMNCNPRFQYL